MCEKKIAENIVSDSIYIAHINLVQNIITRMAGNSYNTKKFSIIFISLLMSAIVSFKTSAVPTISYLLIGVIIAFWLLDAFYVYLERDFVKLHKEVASKTKVNFDMSREKGNFEDYLEALFSMSVLLVYPLMIISIIVVSFITKAV